MNSTLIAVPAIVFYLGSSLLIGLRLFRRTEAWIPPRFAGITLGFAGVCLQAMLLYQSVFTESGLNLGFFNAASLVAWDTARADFALRAMAERPALDIVDCLLLAATAVDGDEVLTLDRALADGIGDVEPV